MSVPGPVPPPGTPRTATGAPPNWAPPGRTARRGSWWRRRVAGTALLAWPVAELAVLIAVAGRIGLGLALLLLLAGAVAGALALGNAATTTLRRQPPTGASAPSIVTPARPATETALLILAGLLLIIPGFLSDVAGLSLLVPAVRRSVARRVGEAAVRRFSFRSVRIVPGEVLHGDALPDDALHGDVLHGETLPNDEVRGRSPQSPPRSTVGKRTQT